MKTANTLSPEGSVAANPDTSYLTPDYALGYAVGFVSAIIDNYSRRARMSQAEFTKRVFQRLQQRQEGI